jgi:hypothetical protein
MRRVNGFKLAIGAAVVSLAAFSIGSALLERESSAQVPSERNPLSAQSLPPAPVLDVPGLMQLFNKPLYLGLKEKMGRQPANEQVWKDLEGRGLQAAEIANLVAIRKVEGSNEPLLQGAAGLQHAGMALADAAKSQQWEATVQAYQGLVQSCNNCHQALAPDEAPQLKP